jgi:hypothetical protein
MKCCKYGARLFLQWCRNLKNVSSTNKVINILQYFKHLKYFAGTRVRWWHVIGQNAAGHYVDCRLCRIVCLVSTISRDANVALY